MPETKLKASQSNVRRGSTSGKPKLGPSSRKKRRITSDGDNEGEDNYSIPESEEDLDVQEEVSPRRTSTGQTRRPQRGTMSRSHLQAPAPDPDKLFEDDADIIDAISTNPSSPPPPSDDIDIDIDHPHPFPDRAPTPTSGPPPSAARRRRRKKKAVPVFSDDEDDYVDSGRKIDERDDDFVVDSPPRRSGKKGGAAAGGKGRGRGAKEKGAGIGEIHIKDERKLPPTSGGGGDAKAGAGAKRRRETISETNADAASSIAGGASAITASVSQSSGVPTAKQAQDSTSSGAPTTTAPPPSKIRKLPPIKKNKALVTAGGAPSTAPSSGPSTPPASAGASIATKAGSGGTGGPGGLPVHTSLPRKPPIPKTSDLDLSSPDIYNSLFKTGSSSRGAPRVGVNSRVKEEERRKELMKMRDEARAARMANLQKNSFDLLAAQTKVTRFETKLRARNSSALYPNHLGSALKLIVMKRSAGALKRPGLGPSGSSGNSGSSGSAGGGAPGSSGTGSGSFARNAMSGNTGYGRTGSGGR